MDAKTKAKDLLDKFESILGHSLPMDGEPYFKESKECALICVDEIIKEVEELHKPEYVLFIINDKNAPNMNNMNGYEKRDFWEDVKIELSKL